MAAASSVRSLVSVGCSLPTPAPSGHPRQPLGHGSQLSIARRPLGFSSPKEGASFRLHAAKDDYVEGSKRNLNNLGKDVQKSTGDAVERAKDALTGAGDKIKEAVTGTAEQGQEAGQRVTKEGEKNLKDLRGSVEGAGDEVRERGQGLGDRAKEAVDDLKERAGEAWDNVRGKADDVTKRCQGSEQTPSFLGVPIPAWMLPSFSASSALASALGALVLFSAVQADAASLTVTLPDAQPDAQVARSLYENLIISGRLQPRDRTGIAKAPGLQGGEGARARRESETRKQLSVPPLERGSGLRDVGEKASRGADAARNAGEGAVRKGRGAVEGALDNIKEQLPGGFSFVMPKESATVAFGGFGEKAANDAKGTFEKVKSDIDSTAGKVRSDVTGTAGKVRDDITTTGNKVTGDVQTTGSKAQQAGGQVKELSRQTEREGKGFVDSIKDAVTGVSEDTSGRAGGVVEGARTKSADLQDRAGQAVDNIKEQAKGALGGFSVLPSSVFEVADAKSGIEKVGEQLQRSTGEAMDFLKDKSRETENEGPKRLAQAAGSGKASADLSKPADNTEKGAYESGSNLAQEESKFSTPNGGFEPGRLLEQEKKGNIL